MRKLSFRKLLKDHQTESGKMIKLSGNFRTCSPDQMKFHQTRSGSPACFGKTAGKFWVYTKETVLSSKIADKIIRVFSAGYFLTERQCRQYVIHVQ